MASFKMNNKEGILEGQEIRHNNIRDSRTLGEKFSDSLENPGTTSMLLLVSSVIIVIYPTMAELVFIISMLLLRNISKKRLYLPFRMPQSSGLIDYNTPTGNPSKPYGKATGIMYLGNELSTRKELWLNDSDARTHFLIFGSTGAGKALRNEEYILTGNGWVKNKDLKVNDYVMRPNGDLSKVIGVYPQGICHLYGMKFEDNREINITSDHLWEVYDEDAVREKRVKDFSVLKTYDVRKNLINKKRMFTKVVSKLDFKDIKLDKSINDIVYENLIRSLNGKIFDENGKKIAEGSYSQRSHFMSKYKSELKKQYGFSVSHLCEDILGFEKEENAKIIQEIARSLGYYAKLSAKEDVNFTIYNMSEKVNFVLHLKEVDFLEITEIVETKDYEECQCIKIEHADGLFVTKDYIVTHNTEVLISLAFNTLVHGSGFIYVDGKGDSSLFVKIYSIVRSLAREDDLLTLNYMIGSVNVSGPQKYKQSNTLNPLTSGTSSGLTQLIVSLMGGGGGGGDGDMWKGRAVAMIGAIMRALVWQRDHKGLLLDIEKVRDNMLLENIQKLATDNELPTEIVSSLNAYLQSLPGYIATAEEQDSTTLEQHGFLQMQFTRILSSLSDDYGYIFKTELGEIDFNDIILNNRILCVLLPALEKSPDELANLGKIVVACLKIMMSAGLGNRLEGETSELLDAKPTNSLSPYMCILDEYGYYVVNGAAVMPAQARSLGFSMVFAGQDYPSFKKNNNSEEASATIGNCNVKIFMKIEDPGDTFDLAKKSAGEASVARASQQEKSTGVFGTSFVDVQNISINKESKLDWLGLKRQEPGRAHIIFKSTMISASMFYANPKRAKFTRLNHFVQVPPPTKSEMDEHIKPVFELEEKLKNKELIEDITSGTEDVNIRIISKLIEEMSHVRTLDDNQKFAAVIAANLKAETESFNNIMQEDNQMYNPKSVNIFNSYADGDEDDDEGFEFSRTQRSISQLVESTLMNESEDPSLKEKQFRRDVEKIEAMSSSNTDEERRNKSKKFTEEVAALTSYPSGDIPEEKSGAEFLDTLDSLLESMKDQN